jgi:hypothetical protein
MQSERLRCGRSLREIDRFVGSRTNLYCWLQQVALFYPAESRCCAEPLVVESLIVAIIDGERKWSTVVGNNVFSTELYL